MAPGGKVTPKHPPQSVIKDYLDYNPETGIFTWRERTPSMFQNLNVKTAVATCRMWNKQWAGTQAGNVRPNSYVQITIEKRSYMASALAWVYVNGSIPDGFQISYIDHNKRNLAIKNLRLATPKEVVWTTKRSKRNSTGLKGVMWNPKEGKYYSQVCTNGVRKFLGFFYTKEAAHRAYIAEIERYRGTFARTGQEKPE